MRRIISRIKEYTKRRFILIPVVRGIIIKSIDLKVEIWGGGIFEEEIRENIKTFLSIEEQRDNKIIEYIKRDIIYCYLRFGSTPQEYFLFGFRGMPNKRRSQFLTNQHKDRKLIKKVGMFKYLNELRNKYIFYKRFNKYFKRDVCKIEDEKDLETFYKFCLNHSRFIIKPIDGMCGQGAKIYEISASVESIKDTFYSLLQTKIKWIVEELIIQDEAMAKWHPMSVNTVRIPTFLNEKGFHVLCPFFRTGIDGNIVDNAACGGIFAVIDPATGVIITDGTDEKGNFFETHPNSHLKYKDWKIPYWNELISLAKEMHEILPSQPYIGWDFALTHEGWVLIEGDWGQFISEFADKKGIKKEFDYLLE